MIRIGNSKDTTSALMAYPGFACPGNREWRVRVSGWAWQTPVVFNMRQRMMIRMLGGVMQATPDQISGDIFQSRIEPFMAEADGRQSIIVTINGRSHRLRKRTRRNGHFFDWINVTQSDVERAIGDASNGESTRSWNGETNLPPQFKYSVSIEGSKIEQAEGVIYLHQQSGLSVISDIDDTIKDSGVGDRRELLANTFLREFRSVDGMADVYRQWATDGARFHYVSSSPWQLYPPLQQLHSDHGFPCGTMHLRNFRLRDQLLKRVIIRRQGKATAIRLLMKSMPDRDFVLVGDSGEKDPKIYLKICRQFQGRVKGVFIRDVDHHPMDNEMFRKLREAVSAGPCARYTSADQLRDVSSELFATSAVAG